MNVIGLPEGWKIAREIDLLHDRQTFLRVNKLCAGLTVGVLALGLVIYLLWPWAFPLAGWGAQAVAALLGTLKAHNIDLVVLAGFLSVLGPSVIAAYPRRILNVHPALIPSFCGPGMYGLRPHEAALARGCKVTGATVHFVNEECDGGPILLQKAVDILPGDTPEVLQKRVMEQAEWKLLPKAVAMVCSGEIE